MGRIKFYNVSIQRDITACAAPDHQFSKVRSDRPADERIAFQHVDGLHDVYNARRAVRRRAARVTSLRWLPQPEVQSLEPNPRTTIAPLMRWFAVHSGAAVVEIAAIRTPGMASR